MAKIKQLKDKSGTEQIFPKTKTQAIYNSDGTLLSETLDDLYGSLATIESSPATTNHSIGEYVLYQGQLYKVTAAITTGDSLVVGTNISAVSAGTEIASMADTIAELNSKLTFQTFSTHDYKATSTNFENVGCSITVPSGRVAIVQCIALFNSGAPAAVALTSNTSTPSDANTKFIQEFPVGSRSGYSSLALLSSGTYYMWVKRNSVPATHNNHQIRGVLL